MLNCMKCLCCRTSMGKAMTTTDNDCDVIEDYECESREEEDIFIDNSEKVQK